jgi:hypothetical protein
LCILPGNFLEGIGAGPASRLPGPADEEPFDKKLH